MEYLIVLVVLTAALLVGKIYLKSHGEAIKKLNKTVVDTSLSESKEKIGKEIILLFTIIFGFVIYFLVVEPYNKELIARDSGAAMVAEFLKWLSILAVVLTALNAIIKKFKKRKYEQK